MPRRRCSCDDSCCSRWRSSETHVQGHSSISSILAPGVFISSLKVLQYPLRYIHMWWLKRWHKYCLVVLPTYMRLDLGTVMA